jgi:hypothetical protein
MGNFGGVKYPSLITILLVDHIMSMRPTYKPRGQWKIGLTGLILQQGPTTITLLLHNDENGRIQEIIVIDYS